MSTAPVAVVALSTEQQYEVVEEEQADASARPALSAAERLHRDFRDTPIAAIEQQLQLFDGDVDQASAELESWSPQERAQGLRDEEGRVIFSWRVPFEQLKGQNVSELLSLEFEREGDLWRLKLVIGSSGDVGLYLQLVSQNKPADYSVERCCRLRALHPTDASRSQLRCAPKHKFPPSLLFRLNKKKWGVRQLLGASEVSSFLHNGWLTLQATVWIPPAGESTVADRVALLQRAFPPAHSRVIERVLSHHGGDPTKAFADLLKRSQQHLRQPLKDEAGREIFTWDVPLEEWRRDNAGVQYSREFEREDDRWRVELIPNHDEGHVGLQLQLMSNNKPAGYSVQRFFTVRALHPTDASRSVWKACDEPDTFERSRSVGFRQFLTSSDVSDFSHNGVVTIQAAVWSPPESKADPVAIAAAQQEESMIQALLKPYPDTPVDVLRQVLKGHRDNQAGPVAGAFAELAQWSPEERKQTLKDDAGHEIHKWRVPLKQLCDSKTDDQCSSQFNRDGENWRLRLTPSDADGNVRLQLQLASQDKPADYGVERCFSLRALHPTDPNRSIWSRSFPARFEQTGGWGLALLKREQIEAFAPNGSVTLQAVVWTSSAADLATEAEESNEMRLCRAFDSTPAGVIRRVMQRNDGDACIAFGELADWSPEALRQPSKDAAGHEVFTWPLSIDQLSSDHAGIQLSKEFQRDGDSWQLLFLPNCAGGSIGLYLALVSEGKPADYSVDRCFAVRVLHPSDASLSSWHPYPPSSAQITPFRVRSGKSIAGLLQQEQLSEFAHKGVLTLQAVVWKPQLQSQASEEQKEE